MTHKFYCNEDTSRLAATMTGAKSKDKALEWLNLYFLGVGLPDGIVVDVEPWYPNFEYILPGDLLCIEGRDRN